jgi:hypothetical protein
MWVDAAFAAASGLAASAWVLLLIGDRWPRVQPTWAGLLVPVLLAVAYTAIFPALYAQSPGGYGSIDALLTLLTSDRRIALASWLHILAFDLLMGCHIVERARAIGISARARAPALVLTFLFGPAGWLTFQAQIRLRAASDSRPP